MEYAAALPTRSFRFFKYLFLLFNPRLDQMLSQKSWYSGKLLSNVYVWGGFFYAFFTKKKVNEGWRMFS